MYFCKYQSNQKDVLIYDQIDIAICALEQSA